MQSSSISSEKEKPEDGEAPETVEDATINTLTKKEQAILNLIASGGTYGEVAKSLSVSVGTVQKFIKNIYHKLSVHSRGEAVFEAHRRGLLNLNETKSQLHEFEAIHLRNLESEREAGGNENKFGARASQGPTRVEGIAKTDALKRESITKALVGLISQRTNVEPLAIGLFGHWGSGKSSQIDFVRKDLESLLQPKVRVAAFNAWQHEKADNLGAALAQTVVEVLVRDLGFIGQVRLAMRLAIRKKSRLTRSLSHEADGFLSKIYFYANVINPLIGPCVVTGFLTFMLLARIDWEGINGVMPWIGSFGAGLIALWIGWHKFVADNLTQWFKRINVHDQYGGGIFSLPDFGAKLGSFHDIHTILKHLCFLRLSETDSAPTEGEYLFLVVDDLDRCSPQSVKQVFDAVRLVANIPRVVTLVAIDERIAFAAVEKHFDQFGFAGREPAQVARDYLAKVFQVSITLPSIDEKNSDQFIQDELFSEELENIYFPKSKKNIEEEPSEGEEQSDQEIAGGMGAGLSEGKLLMALPEEVRLFAWLARKMRISNPRELWRMKQAWYLLKGIVLHDGDGIEEMKPWMLALFARESILQAPVEARVRIEGWLAMHARGEEPAELPGKEMDLVNLVKDALEVDWDFVNVVLLPAAPLNRTFS